MQPDPAPVGTKAGPSGQPAPRPYRAGEDEANLVLREAGLDSLVTFAETCKPSYRADRFHRLLAGKLEDCFRRKIRRLCISTPPRHGKTLTASAMFPAWALTKRQDLHIIQAGYSAELAEGCSRLTKVILSSDAYRELYPPILNPTINRQRLWQTRAGGSYFATGVGGGAVGRGADIFIVDDPIKNREEANSPTRRDAIWNWFISTAMTRLAPDGVMIVIQTRWHEDDLIGRLTDPQRVREMQEAGCGDEAFEVLALEAICENPETDPLHRAFGEALWPERWSAPRLEGMKAQLGPYEFAAQYQQRPAPPGGNLVDTANIKFIDRSQVPADLVEMRGWDLALTIGEKSDFSVGAKGGIHKYRAPDGTYVEDFYLTHIHRGKQNWPEQKQIILNLITQEAVGGTIGLEAVGAFKIAAAELKGSLNGRCIVKSIDVHRDKIARANPWMAMIFGGKFFMVRGPWNREFISELTQFPNGAHDDQVDAVSVLYQTVHRKQVLCVA